MSASQTARGYEYMDKQQKVFTGLLVALRASGYDVYDGFLPPEGVPYPFIYLGESQQNESLLKGGHISTVYQTIHVYHNNPRARGTMSAIMAAVKQACYNISANETGIHMTGLSQQMLHDTTTSTPLMHGIVEATYR